MSKEYKFSNQTSFYQGKVRDVYGFGEYLLMITSDRISAFDVVLPKLIPFKGQVLNQIASYFLNATRDIVPNWLISTPDANAAYGFKCEPIPIEMVIRNYMVGHLWREYSSGKRVVCGVVLPDGLRENEVLPSPIITPTTKAHEGHDQDNSLEEIVNQNIVSETLLKELVENNGGKMASGITSKTNFLIAGSGVGPSKLEKAQQLGVTFLSEDELINMIQE